MSIFTNGLRTVNVLGKAASNLFSPGQGRSVMGAVDTHNRGTIVMDFPVRAGSSTIAAWFEGGLINFGTNAFTGDMLTSLSVRRYVGGVGAGSFVNVCTDATVKNGQTYTSAPVNLTVTAGEVLRVDCWGAAESGKFLPGTQQANPPALGETGPSLVFTGDGSANDAISQGSFVWIWGMGLGKTRAEAMAAVGHSMIPAEHNNGDSAQSLAADALGVPYCGFGAGGSLPDAMANDGDWDQILVMGQRVLIQWMVNACNNFAGDATLDAITGSAIPTYQGGTWTTSMAALLHRILRRYAALGCRCYVCTENYPGPVDGNTTLTNRRLHVWHQWNEWLVNSGPAYYGSLLTGVIDTRPGFATQPYESGVPVSGGSTGIHSNYALAATRITAYFSSGGAGESAFVPGNNNYVEAFYQLFHGVSGTPGAAGALPSGWTEWYFTGESPRLAVNGKSCLKVVSPTTKTTYAICDTPVGGSNAAVEFTVSAYSTVWTAQSNNQGLHIGLHATSGAAVNNNSAASFHHEGYSFTWSNNGADLRLHFRRYNPNAIQTSEGLTLLPVNQVRTMAGLAIAAGQVLSVHITRTYVGGNNVFTFLTYVDGALIDTWTNTDTTISANAAVQALYDGLLYVSLGTAGDTSTTHTNGSPTWDAIRTYNYDATVIDDITGPALIRAPRGGSVAVDLDVTQSAPTAGAAVGVVVTTNLTGLAGAAIGSAATTDGTGTARLSEGNALSIPDTLPADTEGVLEVTCGGVTVQIPVLVVEDVGTGGGGARSIFGGYLT